MKTALITGVSSGIGNKIASELIQSGCDVYGFDINECDLDGLHFFNIDITNEEKVIEAIINITNKTKIIDYVINCAGIISVYKCYRFCDIPMEEWERVIDVNLKGSFIVSKVCIPYMKENGCLIYFSSEQVEKPNLKSAPYAISKAGIEMMNKIIAVDCLEKKIRSNVIALGSVDTRFIAHMLKDEELLKEKMQSADERMTFGIITVDDVWKIVRFVLFDANKMTGQKILVDSGMLIQ